VLVIGTAVLILTNHLMAAGFLMLGAGLFDTLDGALARLTSRTTRFGAILDSTIDRISEALLLLCILIIYINEPSSTIALLAAIAIPSSLLVSYIRARAEAMGLECKAGIFTRTERVVVLALGLILSQFNYALTVALSVIVIFSLLTVIHRLVHVWQQAKGN